MSVQNSKGLMSVYLDSHQFLDEPRRVFAEAYSFRPIRLPDRSDSCRRGFLLLTWSGGLTISKSLITLKLAQASSIQ